MGGTGWFAGVVTAKCLEQMLNYSHGDTIQWCPIHNGSCSVSASEAAPALGVGGPILISHLRRHSPAWVCDGLTRKFRMRNLHEEIELKRNGVDLIFGATLPYSYGTIPTLSWIYDFQHIHMPEMFSSQERLERDRLFLRTAKVSTRIVVTSESVKKDFQNFAPQYADKARVVRTAPHIAESFYSIDCQSVSKRYHLPDKFIYLPNQFFKHKNHEIVFYVLKKLKEKGIKINVICSGYPHDYRNLGHAADLFRKLSEWGIREQVIYLGMIPYSDVLLLMRQCICVVNPSLFEGFGLSVCEAAAIGKQVLISDIDVHREHKLNKATFFDPCNSDDLEQKMSDIWRQAHSGPDQELEKKTRENYPKRMEENAQSFITVVKEVMAK
jgi:glycosyltransferase involved in cell wall biosynthesis